MNFFCCIFMKYGFQLYTTTHLVSCNILTPLFISPSKQNYKSFKKSGDKNKKDNN